MSDVPSGAPAPSAAPVAAPTDAPVNNAAPLDNKPVAPKAPEPPKSTKKQYKVKVDGREESVDLDLSNDEELIKHLQMSKVANKRMQSEAEIRKGVQELLDTLRTNPLKVLTDPRLNIPDEARKKLAEALMNEELQEMSKTPEQREKEKLQKEYERLKQQVEIEKQAREAAEFRALQEQQAVSLDSEISSAIESSGLPKNARTVRYFAEAMAFALQNGIDLSAKDLAPYVKKQALSEFKEMISSLPDDDFESWVGKDKLSSIRKKNLAKAKAAAATPSGIKETGADAIKKDETPVKKMSTKEFLKSLGSGRF